MGVLLVSGIIAAILTVPQAAFAAQVHIDIVEGATPLGDRAYSPNPAQANVGDTVIWTNRDSAVHTATTGTAADGPTGMCGGTADAPAIIPPSRTQQCEFKEAGDFPYYCVLHPTMVGMVMVTEEPSQPQIIESSGKVTINGEEYPISAISYTTNMTGASLEDDSSLAISFDKAGDVILEIPKAVIANVTAITVNGEVLSFAPTVGYSSTTVKLTVPADNVSIVIVPEFPFALILLAGTFATVISFLKLRQRSII